MRFKLSVVFFIFSIFIFANEYYPMEKTYIVESSIFSGVNSNHTQFEYHLEGYGYNSLFKWGLFGGYNFNNIYYGADLGYKVNPFKYIGLMPKLGIYYEDGIKAKIGISMDLNLIESNFITFDTGITGDAALYFMFGIKSRGNIFLPVFTPNVNINLEPKRFSPDGDGIDDNLFICTETTHKPSIKNWTLNIYDSRGILIYTTKGDGIPEDIISWDGLSLNNELILSAEDYNVEFILRDYLNRVSIVSKEFLSDILVEDIDGKKRIKIASIIFPPGESDFKYLERIRAEENNIIIKKIYSTLLKYPDYNIIIEGYGNYLNYNDKDKMINENINILKPLTLDRAKIIKEALVSLGMDSNRISTVGMGGDNPLVDYSDSANNWKNRRVEFILVK